MQFSPPNQGLGLTPIKSLTVSLSAFPLSTGGYYLTTLYASLYYISSFQPRLAARQLSVEAQKSLNQWHRRRTLHCNQSRRSKHRRTIRRQPCRDRGSQDSGIETGSKEESVPQSPETETGSKEESEKESVCINVVESQQQTESTTEALQSLKEETSGGRDAEDESQTTTPASDCNEQDTIRSKQEERQTLCTVGEEDHRGL